MLLNNKAVFNDFKDMNEKYSCAVWACESDHKGVLSSDSLRLFHQFQIFILTKYMY